MTAENLPNWAVTEYTLWVRPVAYPLHWRLKTVGPRKICKDISRMIRPSLESLMLPPGESPLLVIEAEYEPDLGGEG